MTSTKFSDDYVSACKYHQIDDRTCTALDGVADFNSVLEFLADDSVALDKRAAVVNASGWNIEGMHRASAYKAYVETAASVLTPSQQIIYGYLLAMDNYFEVTAAENVLSLAAASLPDDFTAQLLYSLVEGQSYLDDEAHWRNVWLVYDADLHAFPPEKRNMRQGAVQIVTDYLVGYEGG